MVENTEKENQNGDTEGSLLYLLARSSSKRDQSKIRRNARRSPGLVSRMSMGSACMSFESPVGPQKTST